jgi:two-component system, NarL family, sensor kinase
VTGRGRSRSDGTGCGASRERPFRGAPPSVIIDRVNGHQQVSAGLAVAAVALAAAGTALTVHGGVGSTPTAGDMAMNVVVAVAFPFVGAVIARHRPGHVLAWVYSAAGVGAAVTLFSYGYARHALELSPGTLPAAVASGWLSSWVWATGVVPLVTLGVLLFPDGRLPSRRWRPVAAAAVAAMVLLAAAQALRPGPLANHPVVDNPLGIGSAAAMDAVGGVGLAVFGLAFLASAVSLIVRWRRGQPRERRQLRWLLYAAAVLLMSFAVDLLVDSAVTSYLGAGALALLPVAIALSITREHLYDIDVIISRSLVYAVLTAGVIVTYVVVVAAVGGLLGSRADLVGPLIATGLVAVAFQPARELLQRLAARVVFGDQADPYASLAGLGRRLEAALEPHAVLPAVVETVAASLRLPYVAIELAEAGELREAAAYGDPTGWSTALLLTHQGETIGRLVLGQRSAAETLSGRERRLLEDLARQAGIAVHVVRLTTALQRSREQLVVAREEERHRLHRDLHDGLGPSLAAMTLQLDVLRRRIPPEAEEARALADAIKADLQAAIPEIRRLIDGLRPPALDELGLLAAVREQVLALNGRAAESGLEVTVTADGELPPLGAATAVAAYRIATEAVTNTLRHAAARHCNVRVACNGALEIDVEDDGRGIPEGTPPGVGLQSMRDRAAELGGYCSVGPNPGGGTRVHARLPLRSL